jgi:hypothetical protein
MKKLALVLSFVFCAAMIAPAFAADPVKPAAKTECAKDGKACAKDGKTCTKEGAACCKAGAASKDGKATVTPPAKR